MSYLRGKNAVVTGGSRGFGRGIVEALAAEGVRVVAIARSSGPLEELKKEIRGEIETVVGDATDPILAARIIANVRPEILVLNAGARGISRPTRYHTWETFSLQVQSDLRGTFNWIREALVLPLERGSTIFVGSSGAALRPVAANASYAAAKAAMWVFARGVADEAKSMGIRVHCLLPVLSPETELGHEALRDFSRYAGVSEDVIIAEKAMKPFVTPAIMGSAVINILTDPTKDDDVSFRVTGQGIQPIEHS
jgi:NAD(P)-dependent dehydrogenase (short-subunit alcohol dehydrogenase family)